MVTFVCALTTSPRHPLTWYSSPMPQSEPPQPRLTPFQRIVAALARVPKAEADAIRGAEEKKLATKRGPKPA